MTFNSLAFRLIAGAALWSGVALVVGGVLLAANFRDAVERNFDDRLIVAWEGLVALLEVQPDGSLVINGPMADPRFQQPFSGWYWQISAGGGHIRSRSLWDELLQPPEGVQSDSYTRINAEGPDNQILRLIARSVRLPGSDQPYTLLVAADRNEISRQISRFNTLLARSFGVFAFGLIVAMILQVRLALTPLRRVREALVAMRSGRAERLAGSFPAEIAPLAEELNALIDHNAEVLERSRTQVGNLAHALKTPLSVLANEAAASPGPLADTVMRQAETMREQVDHYLARARAAATSRVIGARTDITAVIEDLTRTLGRIYADKALAFDVQVESAVAFRGERQDLEEVIGNLLDNASKWARQHVVVTVRAAAPAPGEGAHHARFLVLTIEDDGPGVPADKRAHMLQRGARADESMPGSGLGLSIVMDIVRLYGGRLSMDESPLGGLAVRVVLPAVAEERGHT